ncbi:nitrilase-related carbon-nitrogen hydrolase [Streptomyces sp. NPDC085540]|uniref:nitrilase-related carbon-nitrogen hydrolase n=1 Tax=Streptomyces sp. NPDC085540 TaxID=3365730 RepID=UPI0037D5B2D4
MTSDAGAVRGTVPVLRRPVPPSPAVGVRSPARVGEGKLIARTRQNHIPLHPRLPRGPVPPSRRQRLPVVAHEGARFGFPTCWDEWFPGLARAYSPAGAEVLVRPTAIGSEVDLPDFDRRPRAPRQPRRTAGRGASPEP